MQRRAGITPAERDVTQGVLPERRERDLERSKGPEVISGIEMTGLFIDRNTLTENSISAE